jgi:alditol oxidase
VTQGDRATMAWMRNWAGNLTYSARRVDEPASIEALQELVRSSHRIRAIGTRHSFSGLADTTGDLVSLARLPARVEVDHDASTASIAAGLTYGEVGVLLDRAGVGLPALASLPHVSVAGACATGTHGSGDRYGCLSTSVRGIELVTADGELVSIDRGSEPESFPGSVVGLGALGIVTRLVLDVEPSYRVRQDVYDDLAFENLLGGFDEISRSADSVSMFTTWRRPVVDQVWLKRRVRPDTDEIVEAPVAFHGATRAVVARHPVPGADPVACTQQLGVPGPWHERLPHFRVGQLPSSGAELQTEYFVDRHDVRPALEALIRLAPAMAPVVLVSEIRTIAADDLWLSPAYGRETVAFHWTWRPDEVAVRAILPAIEAALGPFQPRAHWAKLSAIPPDELWSRYPKSDAFAQLARTLDPEGKFRNGYLEPYLG